MPQRTIQDIQRETVAAIAEMDEATKQLLEHVERGPPWTNETLRLEARWKETLNRVLDLGQEAERLNAGMRDLMIGRSG